MMSDCVECWNTPCTCGYEYRSTPKKHLAGLIASMVNYKTSNDAIAIIEDAIALVKTRPATGVRPVSYYEGVE